MLHLTGLELMAVLARQVGHLPAWPPRPTTFGQRSQAQSCRSYRMTQYQSIALPS